MTLKSWQANAAQKLEDLAISKPAREAQLILAHALGQPIEYVIAHDDDDVPAEIETQADILLARRLQFEPLAYITEYKEFFGLPLKVDNRALIPRGESECLVEAAIEWLGNQEQTCRVAEVGTGSGAIILALANRLPQHTYVATELSQDALELAQENAAKLEIKNVEFLQGNLAQPLIDAGYEGQIDCLIANLPYIASDRLTVIDPGITYFEPHLALDGGGDGLDLYRQFMPQAVKLLKPNGLLLCEHEDDHGEAMRNLAGQYLPHATCSTGQDYMHHDRYLQCEAAPVSS